MSQNQENSFLSWIIQDSRLQVKNRGFVEAAYKKSRLLGLFHLFITPNLKNTVIQHTNMNLSHINSPVLTLTEFDAYMGLEMAMIRVPLNTIKEYWSLSPIVGKDFLLL